MPGKEPTWKKSMEVIKHEHDVLAIDPIEKDGNPLWLFHGVYVNNREPNDKI